MTYVNGNPVGYDPIGLINSFKEPCPNCGVQLFEIRATAAEGGNARLDAECPRCDGAWVYTAAPAKPDLKIAYRVRKPRPWQGELALGESDA